MQRSPESKITQDANVTSVVHQDDDQTGLVSERGRRIYRCVFEIYVPLPSSRLPRFLGSLDVRIRLEVQQPPLR